jgi:hypothetical protein
MTRLDLSVHRYRSACGRWWSSPEIRDFVEGKIDQKECSRLMAERQALAGGSGSELASGGDAGHKDLLPSAKETAG